MKPSIIIPNELILNKLNIKKITILVLIALLGIAMVVYAKISGMESSSTLYTIINTFGYIGLVVVLVGFFTASRYSAYAPTQSRIIYKVIEFNVENSHAVEQIVSSGKLSELENLAKNDGETMKLEIAYSEDAKFAAYQYFKYVPYEFVPASEVCVVDTAERVQGFCI